MSQARFWLVDSIMEDKATRMLDAEKQLNAKPGDSHGGPHFLTFLVLDVYSQNDVRIGHRLSLGIL